MVYPDFHKSKIRLEWAESAYQEILEQKEELMTRVEPTGTDYGKDRIQGSPANQIESYVITADRIKLNERLECAKEVRKERREILSEKLFELQESSELDDIIYRMYFVEKWKVQRIAYKTHYSKSQVYRRIQRISKTCDDMRKEM